MKQTHFKICRNLKLTKKVSKWCWVIINIWAIFVICSLLSYKTHSTPLVPPSYAYDSEKPMTWLAKDDHHSIHDLISQLFLKNTIDIPKLFWNIKPICGAIYILWSKNVISITFNKGIEKRQFSRGLLFGTYILTSLQILQVFL